MCGIAGIFGSGAREHRDAVGSMIASMYHRGPDAQGLYVSPSGMCVFGHSRLSILDLTEAAAQPMISPDGRYAFVYNGECYNFLELRKEFADCGENLISTGDTEVVFRLLVRKGVSILPELNAMFALALWDEQDHSLLLARDRYGQKPLYFTRIGKLVIFASEVRAILASGLIDRKADSKAIYSYLFYGAIQEPFTIVSGVSLLSPGSFMGIGSDEQEKIITYWKYPLEKKILSSLELRESFTRAVKRHFVSDVPLGLFLSGGIDSSSLVAAAVHGKESHIHALSVVFPGQPSQSEENYAAIIADRYKIDHRVIPITGDEMLKLLPGALDAMDQPTVDAINTYIVSYAAHQAGLKVALSGLGGDEFFGGYPSFSDVPRMLNLRRLFAPFRNQIASLFTRYDPFAIKASKLARLFDISVNLLSAYLVRRMVFSSRQIKLMAPEFAVFGCSSGLSEEFINGLKEIISKRDPHDAIGLLEMRMYMGQMLLRDADVMGMAHGLEIRLPFLDTEFSSDALELEPQVRIPRSGRPKWRFVEAMGDWLPEDIGKRKKMGFILPLNEWMQHELKKEVEEGMHELAHTYRPIQESMVSDLWEQFCSQPQKIGWARPWALFVLGRYLKKHRLNM